MNELIVDLFAGGGGPVWHASIARLAGAGWVVPLATWERTWHDEAGTELTRLLNGVGRKPDYWQRGKDAMHLRRSLTRKELAQLDPQWIALPAIDEA